MAQKDATGWLLLRRRLRGRTAQMMKCSAPKTLVIYIGANKTGSSAIQEFLRLNTHTLADHGLVVAPADLMPRGPISGQHVPFLEHLRDDLRNGSTVVAERMFLSMRDVPAGGKLIVRD